MTVEYDPHLRIVDVVAEAREVFGAEAVADLRSAVGLPDVEHAYRFVIDTPTGGELTFNRSATAEYVMTNIERLKTEGARNGR
jgi:hypothetical protein